jgi:magnesium transporter
MPRNHALVLPDALTKLPDAPLDCAKILVQFRAADAAEALNRIDTEAAARVLAAMPVEAAVPIFNEPHLDEPEKLIELLPIEQAVAILKELYPDCRANIFRKLSPGARERLAARLDPSMREALEKLLAYPPHSAGGIMTTEFVSVPADWTVAQVLTLVREVGADKESIYAIYIIDPQTKQLVQTVSLRQLLISDPDAPVISIVPEREPIVVTPLTDREDVSRIISKYNLLAVPVIAEDRHILGIVTVDDVIDAIIEEFSEDVQKFGGTEAFDEPYLKISFTSMVRKRAGWLCVLFLSEMLTASAMQHYQAEIEKAVVLALFIPLIMSSGGNSGSQATSLIIRALALHEVTLRDWWRIASRELPASLTLGTLLGVIGILRIVLWQTLGIFDYGPHWPRVALTVGLALVAIVTFGSMMGSMLPFVLKSFKLDPATASAPFVATLVDVTGLVIYFSVAYFVLAGSLL